MEVKSEMYWTPLIQAAHKGHKDIVEALLDKGAVVNVQSKAGWTALMTAAFHGETDIVRLLLERGADTAQKNSTGDNARMVALRRQNLEIVGLLEQWPVMQRARELDAITKMVMGGLTRAIPYKNRFRHLSPPEGKS